MSKDKYFNKQVNKGLNMNQATKPQAIEESATEESGVKTLENKDESVAATTGVTSSSEETGQITGTDDGNGWNEVTNQVPPVEETSDKEKSIQQQSHPQQQGFKPVYKVELDLNNYNEAMERGKAVNPEDGGRRQYGLFKAVMSMLDAKDQQTFNDEFNTALNFFAKNKDGVFNEKFIYRFPEQWPGSSSEYTINRRLLMVMITTANPQTRKKALEEINLEKATDGLTESQKNKLINFYL